MKLQLQNNVDLLFDTTAHYGYCSKTLSTSSIDVILYIIITAMSVNQNKHYTFNMQHS